MLYYEYTNAYFRWKLSALMADFGQVLESLTGIRRKCAIVSVRLGFCARWMEGGDMKKLILSEWEEKYTAGPVERFDQKNQGAITILGDTVLSHPGLLLPSLHQDSPRSDIQGLGSTFLPK